MERGLVVVHGFRQMYISQGGVDAVRDGSGNSCSHGLTWLCRKANLRRRRYLLSRECTGEEVARCGWRQFLHNNFFFTVSVLRCTGLWREIEGDREPCFVLLCCLGELFQFRRA